MVFSDGPLLRHGVRSAAIALNAYQPLSRTSLGMLPSFAFSLGASEYPLVAMGLSQQRRAQILATRGLPLTPIGWAGLGMAAAADVGYLGLFNEARKVGPMLGDALKAELGADYAEHMAPPLEARSRRRARGLQRLQPDSLARYRRARDVAYGPHGKANHLDIWRRRGLDDDGRAPVVIQIHGGAWTIGSKRAQGRPLLTHLVERGWVCVAINYRHAPADPFPAQIIDVKRAIAWVKEHIAEHGGDPDFIVVTGGSAGGHLTSLAALTAGVDDFQPGFEDVDTSVQAAVPFYGVYDFLETHDIAVPEFRDFLETVVMQSNPDSDRARWEQASPIYHVGDHAPPFMMLHGMNDLMAHPAQAVEFARRLREVSENSVVHVELPLAQHAFDVAPSIRTVQSVRAVRRFLESTWRASQTAAEPASATA